MYYSKDKGTYFTSPEIVPAIPTLSEFFFCEEALISEKSITFASRQSERHFPTARNTDH